MRFSFLYRLFLLVLSLSVVQPLSAQEARTAWDLLVDENPDVVDDHSISWKERLILHALTPHQADRFFSGEISAQEVTLSDGRTLARYLEEKLNPPPQVYIPLASSCRLFRLQGPTAAPRLLEIGGDLSGQGGSTSGCGISEAATAILIQLEVRAVSEESTWVKVWSNAEPEPARPGGDQSWPASTVSEFSYETLRAVSLCRGSDCEAGLKVKLNEAAAVSGEVVGYFRSVQASDQPGGITAFLTEGASNNFFGTGAGANNTGSDNSFFGGDAGTLNTSGSSNSLFGEEAGTQNTTGNDNAFFGEDAGLKSDTASSNSFFGENVAFQNSSGSFNSYFGEEAGFSNTTGFNNSFFGHNAGRSNTEGNANAFMGVEAGRFNDNGSGNSFFGVFSGSGNASGSNNLFLGIFAGDSMATENNNTSIGALSDGVASITNATAIGFRSLVQQSDTVVLGSIQGLNNALASTRLGIGTDTPGPPLHIQRSDGTVRIILAQSLGPEAARNLMDLINNGMAQFRLIDTSANGDAWQFSNTDNNLNISLQGSGSQEFLIENDGDVFINNGTVEVTSSRNSKENFFRLESEDLLDRILRLEISEWNYQKESSNVRHIGPVSEDFYRLFQLGEGNKHVSPTDLSGLALEALRVLLKENGRLKEQLAEIQQMLTRLESLATAE